MNISKDAKPTPRFKIVNSATSNDYIDCFSSIPQSKIRLPRKLKKKLRNNSNGIINDFINSTGLKTTSRCKKQMIMALYNIYKGRKNKTIKIDPCKNALN